MSRRDDIIISELKNAQQLTNASVFASLKLSSGLFDFFAITKDKGSPSSIEQATADLAKLKLEDSILPRAIQNAWMEIDKKLAAEGLSGVTSLDRDYWKSNLPPVQNPADLENPYGYLASLGNSFLLGLVKDAVSLFASESTSQNSQTVRQSDSQTVRQSDSLARYDACA
jgi:hypothetical protein